MRIIWIMKKYQNRVKVDEYGTLFKELGPRTAKLALSICLKIKMVEYVWKRLNKQMDPCWFHVCSYDVIFTRFLNYDVINSVIITEIQFCDEISKISTVIFSHTPKHNRSNFGNHTHLEHFKKILCISEIFGSRGGDIEILTMIDV